MKVPENIKIQHTESSDAVVVRRRNTETSAIEERKLQETRAKGGAASSESDTVAVSLGQAINSALDPEKILAERNERKERIKALIEAGNYQIDPSLIFSKLNEAVNDELAIMARVTEQEKVNES